MEFSIAITPSYFTALSNKEVRKIRDKQQTVQQSKQLKILVIEDDPIVQKVHCMMLERMGHKVDTANNGKQAISLFNKNNYDVILTDVRMPDMSGTDVTKEIRRIEGNQKHIPIIAITADGQDDVKDDCLAAGADKFATKPIKPNELKELLQQAIEATVIV